MSTFTVSTSTSVDFLLIDKMLDKTKGQLFFQKGSAYLGRILCDVRFSWTDDLETAAISPGHLYWNPEFFLSIDERTRVTVLAHELLHNALLHTVRLRERCPDIWNIAADHVINLWLNEHGFYMDGFPYCMDPQFTGWNTEQIYDYLIKPGGGGMKPFQAPSTYESGGLGTDIVQGTAEDVAKAVASASAAVSAARIAKQPGTIPGEAPRVIDEFLNPKLPWDHLLLNHFNSFIDEEFSYARPRRRYDDPYLPGRTGRNGLDHLLYAIDISGSTFFDPKIILKFFSEVKYIHEALRPERISIMTFDTMVRDTWELERDDDFRTFEITGGGGTDLLDLFEKSQALTPNCLIVFTDLEVNIPPNPGFPVIWIVLGDSDTVPPYGKCIKLPV